MNEWQQFDDPAFGLAFAYPQKTPRGHLVEKAESRHGQAIRLHLALRDSQELYFEITRYPSLSPLEEYRQHRDDLEQRFDKLKITDVQKMDWKSSPAYQYSFEWAGGKRTVLLVERNGVTYRILYDPRSSLNLQVLQTVEWTER